jgi:hypothetical protein
MTAEAPDAAVVDGAFQAFTCLLDDDIDKKGPTHLCPDDTGVCVHVVIAAKAAIP